MKSYASKATSAVSKVGSSLSKIAKPALVIAGGFAGYAIGPAIMAPIENFIVNAVGDVKGTDPDTGEEVVYTLTTLFGPNYDGSAIVMFVVALGAAGAVFSFLGRGGYIGPTIGAFMVGAAVGYLKYVQVGA